LFDMPAKESDSRLPRQHFSPETAQSSQYTAPPRIRDCERFHLTILGMDEETLHKIWAEEDDFIDDFQAARERCDLVDFEKIISQTRSIHFLLKPAEDGTAEIGKLPPPFPLATNLDLIPGRLTMHMYEDKIAGRLSDVYQGEPLAIRTVLSHGRLQSLMLDNMSTNM
jgi:hypothetical protein